MGVIIHVRPERPNSDLSSPLIILNYLQLPECSLVSRTLWLGPFVNTVRHLLLAFPGQVPDDRINAPAHQWRIPTVNLNSQRCFLVLKSYLYVGLPMSARVSFGERTNPMSLFPSCSERNETPTLERLDTYTAV